jgi:hypothetical protein
MMPFQVKESPEYKAKNGATYKLESTLSGVFLMRKQKNNKWVSVNGNSSHGSKICRTIEHLNPSWLSK